MQLTRRNVLIAVLLLVLALVGVAILSLGEGNRPPPFRPVNSTPAPRNDSIIKTTVHLDMGWLNDEIRKSLPDPLAEESGEKIVAAVNVIGQLQVTRLVDVVIKEKYEDRICSAWSVVIFGPTACLSYKTVEKTRDVTRKVEEIAMKEVSRVVDVEANVDYRIWPTNSAVKIQGTRLAAVLEADFKVKLNAKLGGIAGDLVDLKISGLTSCGYGETPAKLRATVVGSVAVTQAGTGLSFANESWQLEWLRPCALTAARIEMEDILKLPLIKKEFRKIIDEAIAKSVSVDHDFAGELKDAWTDMAEPIEISKTPATWLLVNPINMYVTNLRGTGDELLVDVAVRARPDISFGAKPAATTTPFASMPIAGDPGAKLYVEASLSYAHAAAMLEHALAEDPVNSVDIKNIWIASDGKLLYVGAQLTRPAKGYIQLFGTPKWEGDPLRLTIPDLDFVANSDNKLINGLAVVARSSLKSELRKRAVFRLEEARIRAINAATTNPLEIKGASGKASIGYVRLSNAKLVPYPIIFEQGRMRVPMMVSTDMEIAIGTASPIAVTR